MRKLKRLLYTLIVMVLLLLLLLLFMATTTSGLRFTIAVAKWFIPGKLTIEQVNGRAIHSIDISGLTYQQPQQQIKIDRLQLQGNLLTLLRHHLTLKKLTINHIDYSRSKTSLTTGKPSKTKTSHDNTSSLFTVAIQQASIHQLRIINGDHITVINQINSQINLTQQQLQIQQLQLQQQHYTMTAKGTVALVAPFQTNLALTIAGHLTSGQAINGQLTLQGNSQQMILDGWMKQPFISHWRGTANDWLTANANVDLTGQWQQLVWIIKKESSIASKQGKFHLHGNRQHYNLTFDSDISGSRLPQSRWHVVANGNQQQLDFTTITINTLKGQLSASGQLQWLPTWQWQFHCQGANLNPGVKWPQWRSLLNFDTTVSGKYQQRLQQLHWQMNHLHGKWLQQPINGQWEMNFSPDHLAINQAKLMVGQNLLTLNGQLNQQWQLNWKIHIPNLKTLYPTASGTIESSGQMSGNHAHPRLQTETTINNLYFHHLTLKSLTAKTDLLWQPQGGINLALQIQQLRTLKQTIRQLDLTTTGKLNQQQWQMKIDSRLLQATAQASGAFDLNRQQWQGQLTTLKMRGAAKATWQLTKPLTMLLGRQQLSLSPFCLQSDRQGQLCGQINWQTKKTSHAYLKATQINLKMLDPLLPSDFRLNAPLSGELTMNRSAQEPSAHGKMTINVPQLVLARPLSPTSPPALELQNLQLTAHLAKHNLQWHLTTAGNNQLSANVTLPNHDLLAGFHGKQKLTGDIRLHLTDLQSLPLFIPALQQSRGQINGKLAISGILSQPQLLGQVKLTQGSATVPNLGMTVKAVQLDSTWQRDQKIVTTGSLQSGQGHLQINATSHWLPPFDSQIKLIAKQLQVMNSNEYKVSATGPLTIAYTQPQLTIKGHLTIPQAILTPKTFSGVETLPDNITYVSEDKQNSQLTLDLGLDLKHIILNYRGLSAQLGGALTLHKTPQTLLTAVGQLKTTQGNYQAYGQELTIDRGNLFFSGGAITNPGINIRAVRYIQALNNFRNYNSDMPRLVGIQLMGTLKNPTVNLFAEPGAFTQANILSYLILGKSTSTATTAQGKELLVAASSLGLAQTGLAQSLEKTFGLSELGFESGQVFDPDQQSLKDNTSFVVGKKLSPRLTVKYSVGLILPVNIFEVIYQLSKHWHIQTNSSSIDNGADIIYTIESG
ncbi:MAG: hypothetical protein GY782_10905 [Gammaproteobacteria bacterium]|nr:hypothetical protein [Gammaproteobacteria bacterium]